MYKLKQIYDVLSGAVHRFLDSNPYDVFIEDDAPIHAGWCASHHDSYMECDCGGGCSSNRRIAEKPNKRGK